MIIYLSPEQFMMLKTLCATHDNAYLLVDKIVLEREPDKRGSISWTQYHEQVKIELPDKS